MTEVVGVPQKIKNFTSFNIIKVSCAGKNHLVNIYLDESSCALTNNGDLFIWGRNKENLFGLGEQRAVVIEPTRVSIQLSYINFSSLQNSSLSSRYQMFH